MIYTHSHFWDVVFQSLLFHSCTDTLITSVIHCGWCNILFGDYFTSLVCAWTCRSNMFVVHLNTSFISYYVYSRCFHTQVLETARICVHTDTRTGTHTHTHTRCTHWCSHTLRAHAHNWEVNMSIAKPNRYLFVKCRVNCLSHSHCVLCIVDCFPFPLIQSCE